MPDLLFNDKLNLFYRAEGRDDVIIGERRLYLQFNPQPDDVFLDIGGHIGVVATMMAPYVKHVVTVEPHPETVEILRKNTVDMANVTVLEGAVRAAPCETTLYLSKADLSSHRVVETKGREGLSVKTYVFSELMAEYEPTILKVDIEGGEWELADQIANLPDYVRELAIEMHVHLRNWRELAPVMIASISNQGFKAMREPRLTPGAWGCVGLWTR